MTDNRQDVLDKLPLEAWQAEIMRMTAFLAPSATVSNPEWWHAILGTQPANRVTKPRSGFMSEDGPYEGGTLTFSVTPTFVDLRLQGVPSEDRKQGELTNIGQFSAACASFGAVVGKWFRVPDCPPIQRLAWGAILQSPVKDREVGYRTLSRYLHNVRIEPEASSDLLYRINRARRSRAAGIELKINRLSSWSVAMFTSTVFSIMPQVVGYAAPPPTFACRIELDFSTQQDFEGELPRDVLPAVYTELVTLGTEVVKEGDVP